MNFIEMSTFLARVYHSSLFFFAFIDSTMKTILINSVFFLCSRYRCGSKTGERNGADKRNRRAYVSDYHIFLSYRIAWDATVVYQWIHGCRHHFCRHCQVNTLFQPQLTDSKLIDSFCRIPFASTNSLSELLNTAVKFEPLKPWHAWSRTRSSGQCV